MSMLTAEQWSTLECKVLPILAARGVREIARMRLAGVVVRQFGPTIPIALEAIQYDAGAVLEEEVSRVLDSNEGRALAQRCAP